MHYLLTPSFFHRWADRLFWPLVAVSAISLIYGLYLAFFASPPDYQQGETVRIMYIHVPSAWMALSIYTLIAIASACYLIWRNPMLHILSTSAAPLGAMFTLLTLITGSIWGKPTWGTWWEWDARMTSVLVLLFLYIGYMALANAFDNLERAAQSCSWLAIAGLINVPIIKFSVEWWNTLHQPASVLKLSGPTIHASMLVPLLVIYAAWVSYFAVLLILRMKTALHKKKRARA